MTRLTFNVSCMLMMAICTPASLSGDTVHQIIANVSQSQMKIYHDRFEDSGLGLWAGEDYNNGSRSRRWNEYPTGPNLGNLEAQIVIRDAFLAASPRLIVTQPWGVKQNVVAELPGLDPDRKDDVYIISGHFDSIDNVNRPGGDDNASGTCGVMEAARVISQYSYAATIKFIAFNGEEGPKYGSYEYVGSLTPAERARTHVINLDMILHGRDDRSGHGNDPFDIDLWTDLTQPRQVEWMDTFRAIAATYVPELKIDNSYDNRASSDHQPFYEYGIPAFTCIEFDIPSWNGGANAEYHTANDFRNYKPNGASGGTLEELHWSYSFAASVLKAAIAAVATEAEVLPPVYRARISNIGANQATLSWITTAVGSTQARYGLTEDYGSSTSLASSPITAHLATLTGLQPGTAYHAQAVSVIGGNEYVSANVFFTTLKSPDSYNIHLSDITSVSASVSWNTDTPGTTQIEYGLTSAYGTFTPADLSLSEKHASQILGLQPDTEYHFRVWSSNPAGSQASGDSVFRTPPIVPEIVVDNSSPDFAILQGTWTTSTSLSPRIGTDYRQVNGTGKVDKITARCRWTPYVPYPAYYDVLVAFPKSTTRTWEAPYKIAHAFGEIVDWQTHWISSGGGTYYTLSADVPFAAGKAGYVELSNNCVDTLPVGADAIKLIYRNPLDQTAPPVPDVAVMRKYTANNELNARWPSNDIESGIAQYQYRVRSSGGLELVPWTLTPYVSRFFTSLPASSDYVVEAKAQNTLGVWSQMGMSQIVNKASPVPNTSAARLLTPGSLAIIPQASVTAVFSDHIYVQDVHNYSAIRVDTTSSLAFGKLVSVAGKLQNIDGEMRLTDGEAIPLVGENLLAPTQMALTDIGGSDLAPLITGVSGSDGAYNTGLLICCVGIVVTSNSSDDSFIIADSNGYSVKVQSGNWSKPSVGSLVKVVGISHFEIDGAHRLPRLLMRMNGEYQLLAE